MYGENYGYRSGLNPTMVQHLEHRVADVLRRQELAAGDVVIDIGSNDGTTLSFFPRECVRIGIDPTAKKFRDYYQGGVIGVDDFFSEVTALRASGGRKARVVTAFSMMYDLEEPLRFTREVANVLREDGLFVFEQSYLPLMLDRTAFDTICHEHLEYYSLRQIDWILGSVDMEVIDVELNDVNGGSFAVVAAHQGRYRISPEVLRIRETEALFWKSISERLDAFRVATAQALSELVSFVHAERTKGKTLAALGASTKGNVLLQAAGLGEREISQVGDVNAYKHGRFTPGTGIPIVSEEVALSLNHDFYIVLPWHFRNFFETAHQFHGRTLVFPLPNFSVVEL